MLDYKTFGVVSCVNFFSQQDAVFFLPHDDKKTLSERALATVMGTSVHLYRDHLYLPRIQRIVQKAAVEVLGYHTASNIPPVWEIENKRTSLILVNWHWSFGSFVRSNPPYLVEVGTMHCREPQPLDKVRSQILMETSKIIIKLFKNLGSM